MLENSVRNIIDNNGMINTFAGIVVVFVGLIAISIAIAMFNFLSNYKKQKENKQKNNLQIMDVVEEKNIEDIPQDELVAIAVAVEIYRKLHFEIIQSEVTFIHGNRQTPWTMLQKNRKTIT